MAIKLTARDFCKGRYESGQRYCTVGWREALNVPVQFYEVWPLVADELGIPGQGKGVSDRNDHPSTTFKQLADAFNVTVDRMGYEIVEVDV